MTNRPEFEIIERLRARSSSHAHVGLGIGDDTALLWGGPADWLVTVDMLLENVHFESGEDLSRVGRKALGVNLSDIAAMAGKPVAAVVALGIPGKASDRDVDRLYDGIFSLADAYGVAIIGGDTNRSRGGWVISITVLGHPTGRGPVRRKGARVGDRLMVTGRLGGSIGGRHLTFEPRLREAQILHQSVEIHAMMDVSDGLGGDVFHLVEESGCGVIIDEALVPIHDDARQMDGLPIEHAWSDGEDFELLFAVHEKDADLLMKQQPLRPVELSCIGEFISERKVYRRSADGSLRAMTPAGFVHRF